MRDNTGNPSSGSGLPVPSRRTFATASCLSLTPRKLRFGILPALACEAGSIDTGNPSPLTHTSPGREPGDCGNERHPALHATPPMLPRIDDTAQPGSCLMGGPRYSPPVRAGGFYCRATTPRHPRAAAHTHEHPGKTGYLHAAARGVAYDRHPLRLTRCEPIHDPQRSRREA